MLRDRIEELLFRLRRDDERMEAQLSSGLAGIFASNAMQREDVVKALEDMLTIPDNAPARKVRVTIQSMSTDAIIECVPNDKKWHTIPHVGSHPSVKVEWAE